MKIRKIFILAFTIFILTFAFMGCSDSSTSTSKTSKLKVGSTVTTNDSLHIASNKENLEKMINYMSKNNNSAVNRMVLDGEAILVPSNTKLNIEALHVTTVDVKLVDGKFTGTLPIEVLEKYIN